MALITLDIPEKNYNVDEIIAAATEALKEMFEQDKTYSYQPDDPDNFYTSYSFQEVEEEPEEPKPLTVQELIEKLKHYPQDFPVVMADNKGVETVVESVSNGCVVISDEL